MHFYGSKGIKFVRIGDCRGIRRQSAFVMKKQRLQISNSERSQDYICGFLRRVRFYVYKEIVWLQSKNDTLAHYSADVSDRVYSRDNGCMLFHLL